MAAANDPAKHLRNEATCSICLDYFQDPVMIIECGHNFCQACIDTYWKGSEVNTCCPECRQSFSWKNLRPNRHLKNMVEAAKQLSAQLKWSPEGEDVCRKHKKAFTLFCKEHEALICTLCERSRAHQNHHVVCTEAATADYKAKLLKNLEDLKKERSKILTVKSSGEKPSLELLKQTQAKKQTIIFEFQQLQKFLEDHQQRHLAKLDDLEREIEVKRNGYARKFEDEISYIDALIGEIEEKGAQSADEFLKDIGSTLDRCEKKDFQFPTVPDSPEWKGRFNTLAQENESLVSAMKRARENFLKSKWIKENVRLDPETAHPRYVVSDDRKSVSWGDIRQDFPYNPKRFEYVRCVLGTKGFTSGKHYWTVDVDDGDYWAVGVARESVEREEEINFEPDEGIWAIALYNDQYKALTSPPDLFDPEDDPEQIQVSLNYDAGIVSFYDADDKTHLYSFKSVDFEGERVFPFFRIIDSSTCLRLSS